MKLYTRRGDAGQTDLFGGQRIDKHAPRIDAIGGVDELNGHIGFTAAACDHAPWIDLLRAVQSRLFEIGADLSAPGSTSHAIPRVTDDHVGELERHIDAVSAELPPMKTFILPGGSELAARLHVARTVCRRAERLCVALASREPVEPALLIYLNRLSDLLFALARRANARAGVADIPWISPARQ